MLVIEVMPFVSLLLAVHYRVVVRLLAARRRGGGEKKEHDEPEDHASAPKRSLCADAMPISDAQPGERPSVDLRW